MKAELLHSISRGTWHLTARIHSNIFPLTLRWLPHQRKQKNNMCAGSPSQTEICVFVLGSVCASRSVRASLTLSTMGWGFRQASQLIYNRGSDKNREQAKIVSKETLWWVASKKLRSKCYDSTVKSLFDQMWNYRYSVFVTFPKAVSSYRKISVK